MAEIVSARTRRAFQDSYVDHAVLRNIRNDFDDAGVEQAHLEPAQQPSGERRRLVEEYYQSVDWSSPTRVRRVLDAFEAHLSRLESFSQKEEVGRLAAYLQRDGLAYVDGVIDFHVHDPALAELLDRELKVDRSQLRLNISRVRNSIDEDPALAIGSSKELVEATCKAILTDAGVPFSAQAEVPELVHLTSEQLGLLAAKVSDSERGARSLKRVLGSLASTVQGLAELRNLYGSGHGRAPGEEGLDARHARLCVGAAATLSLFLMETAIEAKP